MLDSVSRGNSPKPPVGALPAAASFFGGEDRPVARQDWKIILPFRVMRALFARLATDYGALAVWLALYAHCDREGKCFPSLRRLAEITNISRLSVLKAIRRLESLGLISKTPQKRKDGGNTVCLYKLHYAPLLQSKFETNKDNRPTAKSNRTNIPKSLRFKVFARDNFTCQYCGRKPPEVELVIDHIVPLCKGGTNDINNLITACQDCNLGKGTMTIQANIQPEISVED